MGKIILCPMFPQYAQATTDNISYLAVIVCCLPMESLLAQ